MKSEHLQQNWNLPNSTKRFIHKWIFSEIKVNYTTFTNFSMKYFVMYNAYTDVSGINSYTMFVHLYVR